MRNLSAADLSANVPAEFKVGQIKHHVPEARGPEWGPHGPERDVVENGSGWKDLSKDPEFLAEVELRSLAASGDREARVLQERLDAERRNRRHDPLSPYGRPPIGLGEDRGPSYREALTRMKGKRLEDLARRGDREASQLLEDLRSPFKAIRDRMAGKNYDARVDEAYGKKREAWEARVGRPLDAAEARAQKTGLLPPASTRVVVEKGDNLVKILKRNGYSEREANDPRTWQRVMRANEQNPRAFPKGTPHFIRPGAEIVIPPPKNARPSARSAEPSPNVKVLELPRLAERPKGETDPEAAARKEMEERAARGDARIRREFERIQKQHDEVDAQLRRSGFGTGPPPEKLRYRDVLTDIKHDRLKEAAAERDPKARQAIEELNSVSDWVGYGKGKLGFGYSEAYNKRVDDAYAGVDRPGKRPSTPPASIPQARSLDPEELARQELEERARRGDLRMKTAMDDVRRHNESVDQWYANPLTIGMPPPRRSHREALSDVKWARIKAAAKEGDPEAEQAVEQLSGLSSWAGYLKGKLGFGQSESYNRRVDEAYRGLEGGRRGEAAPRKEYGHSAIPAAASRGRREAEAVIKTAVAEVAAERRLSPDEARELERYARAIAVKESGMNLHVGQSRVVNLQGEREKSYGMFQINLRAHQGRYDVERGGKDPAYNARYGVGFLADLYVKSGSWSEAVRRYNGAGVMAERYRDSVISIAARLPERTGTESV